MAKYKVWFTIKDKYGKTKEVAGGDIDVNLGLEELTQPEVDYLENRLPFEDYVTQEHFDDNLLPPLATEEEVDKITSICYSKFTPKQKDVQE